MREIILAVLIWIHLLSTVVWIGGIFFILFLVLPVAKKTLEEPGKLMGAIGKRFLPLANISILLIIVTGIFMTLLSYSFSDIISLNSLWSWILLMKVAVVLMMMGIHFYRGLILTPKIERLTGKGNPLEISKLQRLSLNLVRTNLVVGIILLFMSSILSNLG